MTDFPAPQPHGALEEIFPDVFVVRGAMRLGPLVSIGRTMVVLREGSELSLVNPIRLSAGGERALASLGEVRHLVHLGDHHGLDEPYYRARFSPRHWSPRPSDASTEKLVDGERGPVARTRAFAFTQGPRAEGALWLEQARGNLLISCDSVQHWADNAFGSAVGGLTTRLMGFRSAPVVIGPLWLAKASGGEPGRMWSDFERLLSLDFVHLVSGHGSLLAGEAHRAVAAACARSLGPRAS